MSLPAERETGPLVDRVDDGHVPDAVPSVRGDRPPISNRVDEGPELMGIGGVAGDALLAATVRAAVLATKANPEVTVFLDGLLDRDRGYYRRHGLVDRHFNPRPGFYTMIEAAASVGWDP